MTITAIPAVTARPRLAPYAAASGDTVLPGCYGVSRGEGITGDLIRHASGARPGHAFIYVGNGRIVAGRGVQHADQRFRPAGQPQCVVHVRGHPSVGDAHAATDRDYVPSPVRCHGGTLAS